MRFLRARSTSTVALLTLSLLTLTSIPVAAKPATGTKASAQAKTDLHTRIQTILNGDQAIITQKDGAPRLKVLMDAAERSDNLEDYGRITNLYAISLDEIGDTKGAKAISGKAIAFLKARGQGDTQYTAALLRSYGSYQGRTGDIEGAIKTLNEVLPIYQKIYGPQHGRVGSLQAAMAFAYSRVGQVKEAVQYYDLALQTMSADDRLASNYASALGNYADLSRALGNFDKAETLSRKALEVQRKYMPNDHRSLGWTYTRLASALMDKGRYQEAVDLFRKALDEAYFYKGKTSFEAGDFQYYLAQAIQKQGDDTTAEALMLQAFETVKAYPSGGSPFTPGMVAVSLGQIAYQRGDYDQAMARVREGLKLYEPLGARAGMQKSAAQVTLAEILLVKGDTAGALAQTEDALIALRRDMPEDAPSRVSAEMLRALILSRLGRTNEALNAALPVEATMTKRLLSARPVEGLDLSRAYGRNYTRLADIALNADKPELAFRAAQHANFTEIAATSQAMAIQRAITNPETSALVQQLQAAQARASGLGRQRAFVQDKAPATVAALDAEIATAQRDIARLEAEVQARLPDYASLSRPHLLSIDAARETLTEKQAILMPLTSDDRTISLILTRKGLSWSATPLAQVKVHQDVLRLRTSIDDYVVSDKVSFDRRAAFELGQAVFTPRALATLKPVDEIAVLGAGPLMTIPLTILLTQKPQGRDDDPEALRRSAWMINRFAVSVRPGLSIAASPHKPTQGFAGIGAPKLPEGDHMYRDGKTLSALPSAEAELYGLKAALKYRDNLIVTGPEATEAHVKATDLSAFSVIAFATHGLTSSAVGNEAALMLTPPAVATPADDGLLTASEIAGLRLDSDWVILSACNTGVGREAGAEGYSGLSQAFMRAGARNILVSLWPVRDDAARRLTVDAVTRHGRGQSKAQALRSGTLRLLRDKSVTGSAHPAVWAPFSLLGNSRP